MDLSSFRENSGISIVAFNPAVNPTAGTYYPRYQVADDAMLSHIQSYSHDKDNSWGYRSMSITVAGPQPYLDEWYEEGLGRHIEVYNSAGILIMAGFVNQVSLTAATLQASRGPLVDICNRVSVVYTPIIDASVSPPLTGAEKSTIIVEDEFSQNRYGILEKVLSGGQLLDDGTTDEAEDYRDRYLDEYKEPKTSDKVISLGSSGQPSIQLEILGYRAWLDFYIYASITTGTTTVSAKMQTVLAADPNGVISTNYHNLEANALLTPHYDNDNRTAKTIIDEMVKRGNDVDDTRRLFGIFGDQKVIYTEIPTTYKYYYKISSKDQSIHLYEAGENGPVVDPWDVQAGEWLFIGDFLPGRFSGTARKGDDPRAMFIESVSFSVPYGLSLNGIGVSELPQYLAKLGVG